MASDRAVEKEELRSKDKLESFIMKENYLVQYVTIHPQPCFRICLWEFPALMLNNSVTSFQVNVNKLLSAFVRRQSYACEAGPFSSNQKRMGSSGEFWYKPLLDHQSKIFFAGLFVLFKLFSFPLF